MQISQKRLKDLKGDVRLLSYETLFLDNQIKQLYAAADTVAQEYLRYLHSQFMPKI